MQQIIWFVNFLFVLVSARAEADGWQTGEGGEGSSPCCGVGRCARRQIPGRGAVQSARRNCQSSISILHRVSTAQDNLLPTAACAVFYYLQKKTL